jgi:SnoaL-like protein
MRLPLGADAVTESRYSAAIEARDLVALAEACTPDVVFHSPMTSSAPFVGHDEVAELFSSVLDLYDELQCIEEFGTDERRVVHLRARIGRRELHEVQILHLDGWEQVREITAFARPSPGVTALAAGPGPRTGHRCQAWSRLAVARRPLLRRLSAIPISITFPLCVLITSWLALLGATYHRLLPTR